MAGRVYLLVETDEGERMCWKFEEGNISDSVGLKPNIGLGSAYVREPHHEVSFSGKGVWSWKPSPRSAALLREAFAAPEEE